MCGAFRNILILTGIVLVVVLSVIFVFLPGYVDGRFNTRVADPPYAVSASDRALADSSELVDLHGDFFLWNRDVLRRYDRGHLDLPRLREAGATLQVFSTVTKSPRGQNYLRNAGNSDRITALVIAQRWPPRTWFSLKERALFQADRFHRAAAASGGALVAVTNRRSLEGLLSRRKAGEEVVGGLLAMEGLHAMEGRMEGFEALVDAGYRMMSFTHFFDNELAGSAHGLVQHGLTPLGRQALREMELRGVVVDLAHVSIAAIEEVLTLARRPVVVSHTGVQATCPGPRNLSDELIKKIGENGGLIGVGVWAGAVCEPNATGIVKAMRHIADLIGSSHVALGSDFDGSVRAAFDITGVPTLIGPMREAGFSDVEIKGILGGNALRLLAEALPE